MKNFPKRRSGCISGFVWESIDGLEVMDYVDVLVDGEFVKEEADPQLHWKGSANQRVIDVKATKRAEKSSCTVLKAGLPIKKMEI